MRRRKISILVALVVVGVAAAIALAVYLRKLAAPEPARLLPDADAFIYVNLKPLRQVGVIGKNPPPITDPEYAQFVQETGFQFERDLDEAAFAVHLPSPVAPVEEKPAADRYPRFSEIFVGHFDSTRVANYFRKVAPNIERYRDVEIFSVPLEGRTVRIALLGVGTAAVSNTDDPRIIHGMIDKYKEIALPFGGPALVKDYYRHVPLTALAWSIARVSPSAPGKNSGLFILPGGYDIFFPAGTVVVASVRYTTGVHVKAEAFTTGEDEARRITEQANAFLTIFRGLGESMQMKGPDNDVKAFFDSLKVEQEKNRAVLTASVPQGFIKKMLEEPPIGEAPLVQGNPQPEQKPVPPKKKERTKKK
jgi:hypothetical protein